MNIQNAALPAYVPGVCNINHAEIARRRKAGHIGAALFVVVLVVLLVLPVSRWFRSVLFVPAFVAAVGYLQAKNKFCVGYGSAGLQNATEGSAAAEKITDAAALAKDKQKTRQINLQSAAIAGVVALICLVFPHL